MTQPRHSDADGYPAQIGVFCDDCGHTFEGDFLVRDTDDQLTRFGYARAHLNREGWSCDDRGDFCPRHKPGEPIPPVSGSAHTLTTTRGDTPR